MAVTAEHMAALTAICYPLCRLTCLARAGLECKQVKHKDYDAVVVLTVNPQGKLLNWFLYWQAHY
jgi:phosphatidylserine synthase